jgi:hypothetical protein
MEFQQLFEQNLAMGGESEGRVDESDGSAKNDMNFNLLPHPQHPVPLSSLQLVGSVVRIAASLRICWELRGNLADIFLSKQHAAPVRRNGLWQTTCFEFFAAPADLPCYWEVNLSPCGDWNVYAFDLYRTGMREEPAIATLPFIVQHQADKLQLELRFPLAAVIRKEQAIDLGLSAVIQEKTGPRSFWALAHCAAQPDFHCRESFILQLPA